LGALAKATGFPRKVADATCLLRFRTADKNLCLIVIEGCVGSGKSTVAKGLAACRSSQLLLEDFETIPFLRAFYEDPVGNATETEFAFLLLHFHQLKSQADVALRSEVITDFHLGKDLLYADLNLKD